MRREWSMLVGALCLVRTALAVAAAAPGPPAQPPCAQPLVTTTVAENSYAVVNVREFGGMVFLYAPEIRSARSGSFDPFQLWVVEGVYGRPFLRTSGTMDQSAFDRLRKNTNVRARPISISRSGQAQSMTVARQPIQFEVSVRPASSGADAVAVRVCRGR
jgi:hypothetical protein